MLHDRERIARDLHDQVIQRLYATGMSLQGALPLIARPEVIERVNRAVDALDEHDRGDQVGHLRAAGQGRHQPAGLRARLLGIADEMSGPLGFAPSLQPGRVLWTRRYRAEIAEQALHALREALSNAARHAEPAGSTSR